MRWTSFRSAASIAPALALFISALTAVPPAAAQEAEAPSHHDTAYVAGEYRVFTGAGAPATIDDIVEAMSRHRVVFVGESHDDPTGHALEAELLDRAHGAYAASRPVALSLEFFEHDVQPIVDEYLAGLIGERSFVDDSRPWPRYETDYRPLIEFAKENGVPVIAANAPRRYIRQVSANGRGWLDGLGPAGRAWLPPVPYGTPSTAYRDQWIGTITEVMSQEGMKCGRPLPETEDGEPSAHAAAPEGTHAAMGNQLDSQSLWDASMAYRIAEHLAASPEALVLHMVGGFHVARGTGTPEHLEAYRPGTSAMIVMLRPVDDVETFDPAPSGEWGDFVIQTDASRTLEQIECRAWLEELDG